MLNLARKNNCKILQASTPEVYEDPLEHPQKGIIKKSCELVNEIQKNRQNSNNQPIKNLNTYYSISKVMIFLLMLQKVYKLIDPSTSKETNNYSYIENTNKKIDNNSSLFFNYDSLLSSTSSIVNNNNFSLNNNSSLLCPIDEYSSFSTALVPSFSSNNILF
ncbi:hypothetical protein U3516DRAFT_666446 [Neocallimastix sp. 'constans']